MDFYLSTNTLISPSDVYVGTEILGSLDPFHYTNPVTSLSASVAPGTYYAGWIVHSSVAEYPTELCNGIPCDNVAVIADQTLTVESGCGVDPYEPDDSSGAATPVVLPLIGDFRSLCPAGDEDWMSFEISEPSQVLLYTSGANDDTRMWLYDQTLAEVEYDDDGGVGLYSEIDRLCGVDALDAGEYFVRIDEFGDNDPIEVYEITIYVWPCDTTIFSDGFESGDTSSWSSAQQ